MFMKLNFSTKIAQKFDITSANDRENEKITRLQQEQSVDFNHNCGLNLAPRLHFTPGFKPVFAAIAVIKGKHIIAAITRLSLPRSQQLQQSWQTQWSEGNQALEFWILLLPGVSITHISSYIYINFLTFRWFLNYLIKFIDCYFFINNRSILHI